MSETNTTAASEILKDGPFDVLAKYSTIVFPYSETTTAFLNKWLAGSKCVVDLGCGDGKYVAGLAKSIDTQVIGIDLLPSMISAAEKSCKDCPKSRCILGDIINYSKLDFAEKASVDGVYCIGNTLANLPSISAMSQMIQEVSATLPSGSKFVLQVVNFDSFMYKQPVFPVVKTEIVDFSRTITLHPNKTATFTVAFDDHRENQRIERSSTWYILTVSDVLKLFEEHYHLLALYGSFGEAPWTPSAFHTIYVFQRL